MAVLRRPLPKLTRWGRSAWTLRVLPVSIRSNGVPLANGTKVNVFNTYCNVLIR